MHFYTKSQMLSVDGVEQNLVDIMERKGSTLPYFLLKKAGVKTPVDSLNHRYTT